MESGRGYNLNLSLFERLQQQGLPVSTLMTQRRMHPDISALIRGPIYPTLQVCASQQALASAVTPCRSRTSRISVVTWSCTH
jgi:AAA domain